MDTFTSGVAFSYPNKTHEFSQWRKLIVEATKQRRSVAWENVGFILAWDMQAQLRGRGSSLLEATLNPEPVL